MQRCFAGLVSYYQPDPIRHSGEDIGLKGRQGVLLTPGAENSFLVSDSQVNARLERARLLWAVTLHLCLL